MAEDAPDIYADGVEIAATPYDMMLRFTRRDSDFKNPSAEAQVVGSVRMSLQQAKVLTILLRKNLAEFERQAGPVNLHPELCKLLGISISEDWA